MSPRALSRCNCVINDLIFRGIINSASHLPGRLYQVPRDANLDSSHLLGISSAYVTKEVSNPILRH